MGFFAKLNGTIASFFQVGGPNGVGWNNNGSLALEARNAANSAMVNVRGALPLIDSDLTTKAYVDQVANAPLPVSDQFNGGSALPGNTATEHWIVTTTSGVNSSIGDILWDDGSNTGTVAVIPAATGHSMVTTAAFTGGTISLAANQMYVWTGSAWLDISPSVAGVSYMLDLTINNAASQSSATQIPANAVIERARLVVTTPYPSGTIALGYTGSTSAFMATTDNTATVNGTYEVPQTTGPLGSPENLLVTVGGAPGTGAGYAIVFYSIPNA